MLWCVASLFTPINMLVLPRMFMILIHVCVYMLPRVILLESMPGKLYINMVAGVEMEACILERNAPDGTDFRPCTHGCESGNG